MFYMDITYVLVLIGAVLCIAASGYMKSAFKKYSRVASKRGMTGVEVADRLLRAYQIYDVKIERVKGDLTDHYDSRHKVLRLSDSVYDSTSVAALGVAAHECGHAAQHKTEYLPLKIRSGLAPVASIGSQLGFPIVLLGLIFGLEIPLPGVDAVITLVDIGIIVFGLAVLFQIITLPVEFDASARAIRALDNTGIMGDEELRAGRKVLNAAALTYVAATASAILSLLRLVLLRGRR